MANPDLNQIRLYASGAKPATGDKGGFPCIMLPADIGAGSDRESFVEMDEGHEPARARLFMARTHFDDLPQSFRDGSTKLGLQIVCEAYDKDNLPDGIREQEIVISPVFYLVQASVARASIDGEPIMEILLASQQLWWMYRPVDRIFNVLADDKLSFIEGSQDCQTATTISDIIGDLWIDLKTGVATPSLPAGNAALAPPNNAFFRNVPGGQAIDRVGQPFGWHLVCDVFNGATGDLQFEIKQIQEDAGERAELSSLADKAASDGFVDDIGNVDPTNDIPKEIDVLFPEWPDPNPGVPRYAIENRVTGEAGSIDDTKEILFVGDHFNTCDPKLYTESLPDIATDRADAFKARTAVIDENYNFAGIYPFIPGASIRLVRFHMDITGFYTSVKTHGYYYAQRQDWRERFNKIKSPHFPELGEPNNAMLNPRDDGTVDQEPLVQRSFWAVLTSASNDCDDLYSWTKLKGDRAGDLETDDCVPESGTENAQEVNGTANLPDGTIVRMWFTERIDDGMGGCEDRFHFEIMDEGFWAKLTAESGGNAGNPFDIDACAFYSWIEMVPDGDGCLEPSDPPVTGTDNGGEVNNFTGIQTDASAGSGERGAIVWMLFNGCDESENKFYSFEYTPPSGTGCEDVWKTIIPDTGDTLVAVGCGDTLRVQGTGGITVTGTLGVPENLTIDGSGAGAGDTFSFWARLTARNPNVAGSNTYDYTKLNPDLTDFPGPVTGTADETNDNDVISTSFTDVIVRVFTDSDGNNENFEYQPNIHARLVTNTGGGTYTFQAVNSAGGDILNMTGPCVEINRHTYLPTDATDGVGFGMFVMLSVSDLGTFNFNSVDRIKSFWASVLSTNCGENANGSVYNINPLRQDPTGGLVDDAQNANTLATEIHLIPGVKEIMAGDSGNSPIVRVFERIGGSFTNSDRYFFDSGIRETWYQITAETGSGVYTATRLAGDLGNLIPCGGGTFSNTITEVNGIENIAIDTIVKVSHAPDYANVLNFEYCCFDSLCCGAAQNNVAPSASGATGPSPCTDVNGSYFFDSVDATNKDFVKFIFFNSNGQVRLEIICCHQTGDICARAIHLFTTTRWGGVDCPCNSGFKDITSSITLDLTDCELGSANFTLPETSGFIGCGGTPTFTF